MEDIRRRANGGDPRLQPADWMALKDRALDAAAEGVTIADARLPDRPLIYVNEGFERMTGYALGDVLGRNCRFLQGPDTDAAAVAEIRAALEQCRDCVVEVLNYRRDGTPFWNRLSISPLRNAAGEVTHFIGIQSDVTARRLAEEGLRRSKEALEQDLRLAARVQQALLPPPETETGTVRIAHVFHPCDDLAGDAVGIVPLAHDALALFLLDVSGHGVGAALLSFTLTHLLSRAPGVDVLTEELGERPVILAPAVVAGRLNRQFPMDRTRQYFTLVYGVLDPHTGRFDYVTAGHPAPLLLPVGGAPFPVEGAGLPIGMIEDAVYEGAALTIARGERLYFFTDGVIEAINADDAEYGHARLLDAIDRYRGLPLRAGLAAIVTEVRAWCGGRVNDDVSLLAIERLG
jgi:sigma-B regulation protein RsbU (phosphoserine phosphatase)